MRSDPAPKSFALRNIVRHFDLMPGVFDRKARVDNGIPDEGNIPDAGRIVLIGMSGQIFAFTLDHGQELFPRGAIIKEIGPCRGVLMEDEAQKILKRIRVLDVKRELEGS